MTSIRRDGRVGTPFSEWVRTNPRLDSHSFGVCNHDIDWIWHQFLTAEDTIGTRTVNHVLLIEEKSNNSDLTFSQRDVMYLVDQALKKADGKKYMTARGDEVMVRFWGYFKLTYNGTCLQCASKLVWNKRQICLSDLEGILRFELNPHTLGRLSMRRHHTHRLPLWGDENVSNS